MIYTFEIIIYTIIIIYILFKLLIIRKHKYVTHSNTHTLTGGTLTSQYISSVVNNQFVKYYDEITFDNSNYPYYTSIYKIHEQVLIFHHFPEHVMQQSLLSILPKLYQHTEYNYKKLNASIKSDIPLSKLSQYANMVDEKNITLHKTVSEFINYENIITHINAHPDYDYKSFLVNYFTIIYKLVSINQIIPYSIDNGNNVLSKFNTNGTFNEMKLINCSYWEKYECFAHDNKYCSLINSNCYEVNESIIMKDPNECSVNRSDISRQFYETIILAFLPNCYRIIDKCTFSSHYSIHNESILYALNSLVFHNNENELNSCINYCLSEAGYSDYFITSINAYNHERIIYASIKNWLGGPSVYSFDNHKIITFMKLHPEEYRCMLHELEQIKRDHKDSITMNDLIDKYDYNNRHPIMKRFMMLYLIYNTDPEQEYMNIREYINIHSDSKIKTLYRAEMRNDDFVINNTITWKNIITSTDDKSYAKSYMNNNRNSALNTQSGINVLFIFEDVDYALVHNQFETESNYYTYKPIFDPNYGEEMRKYFKPPVLKYLTIPNRIVTANEYFIKNEPFRITELTRKESYIEVHLKSI